MRPQVHIDQRKWPDRPHWRFATTRLGQDEHGVWLDTPAGTMAQRGHEPMTSLGVGFVTLIPEGTWWTVEFYSDHPDHTVYINIGTPPTWHGDRVVQVDLDLDVVRTIDGTVLVLDEDEFDDHRVRFDYPDAIVQGAITAAEDAVSLLGHRPEPFASAWKAWMELARSG